jgi:3-oxoacyl-[acyl-carrier-protein] synthase II
MEYERIVITGMGALTPIGNNVTEFWKGLVEGKSGCETIKRFDASKYKTRIACEVKNFDPNLYFDRKEARRLDSNVQIVIAASDEAMTDANLVKDNYDPERIGVIVGSGIGGFESFQEECINYGLNNRTPKFSPFFIPKIITDMGAGIISMRYNLRGPNFAVVSACATSNNAMIEGLYHLRLNKADIMVCGGTEMGICEGAVGGFSSMKALSERNDDPQTASRPYDKDRDGFVIGEGAAILILERLDHALKRGAKIYAELAGAGASGDAYHMTAPHPEGLGAKKAMALALEDAGMQPADIDYINTHGTSTSLGDIAETKAIKYVFGDHIYNLNISSTKSMTGHCLGAAGAIEAIACIKSINEGIVPPTINHFTDDPELDSKINFTFNAAQHRKVKAALSNSFGFGGHNATLIFKEYTP